MHRSASAILSAAEVQALACDVTKVALYTPDLRLLLLHAVPRAKLADMPIFRRPIAQLVSDISWLADEPEALLTMVEALVARDYSGRFCDWLDLVSGRVAVRRPMSTAEPGRHLAVPPRRSMARFSLDEDAHPAPSHADTVDAIRRRLLVLVELLVDMLADRLD